METVLIGGFFFGLIYGLLGVGIVVCYRGSRVVNFAYAETGMLAAFVYAEMRFGMNRTAAADTDNGLIIPLLGALVVGALLGAVTEFAVVRPLRNAPRVRALVGTVALGSLFLVVGLERYGADPRFVQPVVTGQGVSVAGLHVQPQQILILVATAVLLVGVGCLYKLTSFGLRLRAIALDPYAASITGVNVNRVSLASWSLAGVLAAGSAVLIAPLVAFNVFFMTTLAIRGFAAALVGGLTSLQGAFIAGVSIGVLEAVVGFKAPVTGLTDAFVAGAVMLLLLLRPGGLVRTSY